MKTAAAPAPSVDQNSTKKEIQTLQRYLIKIGLLTTGADSGNYDSTTLNAVARFQEWMNQTAGSRIVDVTGVADPTTLSYLEEAVSRGISFATAAPTEIPDVPDDQ